jgi:hypothetical protein
MSSDTSVNAIKVCCACGADVTGRARMKDSQSRYWCIECGEADKRRKALSGVTDMCVGCRKPFPKAKLKKHGEYHYCPTCLANRTHSGSKSGVTVAAAAATAANDAPFGIATAGGGGAIVAASSTSHSERKRVLVLAGVLALLILLSILFNFVFLN